MPPRGYIDGVIGGQIVGWAMDENRPGARLEVSASLDGQELETVVADRPRSDLVSAGFGDGRHGFRVPLPSAVLAPGSHLVVAQVAGYEDPLPLARDWIARGDGDAPLDGVVLRAPTAAAARELATDTTVGLIGTANWLFAVTPEGVDAARGADPGSHAELDAEVAAVEGFVALAAELNATPCLAVLPDKLQVYAEHAPPGLTVDPGGRRARRLAARLRDGETADLLDLLDPLVDARTHGRVFTRTGRGLSRLGAFHGYRAVAKTLARTHPVLAPRPVGAAQAGPLEPVADSLSDGPLAVWLDGRVVGVDALQQPVPADAEPALELAPVKARRGTTALIVHDAATERIAALLAEHLARVTLVLDSSVRPDVARQAKPDLIVWLRAERA